jgi:hypothetical protein
MVVLGKGVESSSQDTGMQEWIEKAGEMHE